MVDRRLASEPEALERLLPSEGVVTRAGAGEFHQLALLCRSVQDAYPIPVVCFDAGLTGEQRDWLRDNLAACTVTPLPAGAQDALAVGLLTAATRASLLRESPFQRAVWLDPHLVVLRGLGELFAKLDHAPVYSVVGGAVSGGDLRRDAELLAARAEGGRMDRTERLEDSLDMIPVERVETLLSRPFVAVDVLLDSLRSELPNASIIDLQLPAAAAAALLRSIAASVPRRQRRQPPAGQSSIKLVCMMGVKSNPYLVDAFLDHYDRLGVDAYVVILHSEPGDPRAGVVLERLRRYGIEPVARPSEFSAALKRTLFLDALARHCTADDWVVYADLDELQVYPELLPRLLAECDELGYTFVRGRFVDRLAAGGQLPEIQGETTVWEQFPFTAPVTERIARGWTGKVCAAKARIPVGEGAHAVQFGVDPERNYVRTSHDPRAHPTVIEVHHFKWDASLARRTREKINGAGGDRDAIDDPSFMHEYHSILEHVHRGRLTVDDVTFAGTPQLHYVRPPRDDRRSTDLPLPSIATMPSPLESSRAPGHV